MKLKLLVSNISILALAGCAATNEQVYWTKAGNTVVVHHVRKENKGFADRTEKLVSDPIPEKDILIVSKEHQAYHAVVQFNASSSVTAPTKVDKKAVAKKPAHHAMTKESEPKSINPIVAAQSVPAPPVEPVEASDSLDPSIKAAFSDPDTHPPTPLLPVK